MRWTIEDYIFCDQKQSLTHEDQVQQLEPILVELLSYFCHHPDVIISRTELIDSVWRGRIITDSAVNRAITKLRKCFGDNAKAPKFIATFPKKGYRFIASVREYETSKDDITNQPSSLPSMDGTTATTYTSNFIVAVFLSVVAITMVVFNTINPDPVETFSKAKPLTRSKGQEWQPRISPGQQYLAYAEIIDDKMRLFVKQLSDGSKIEINPTHDTLAWVGPASWNARGDKLVYLVASDDYCKYYIQSFSGMSVGKPIQIHECAAGSYGKIEFTHSDNLLVFAERSNANKPYELFTLQLDSREIHRLNQPDLYVGGNLFFDLHPTQDKLLISSPDEQLWEGFYSLDLHTERLDLLFKLDAYICCAIWDHTGNRVVMMGEHPATQLVSYDLSGEDRQVIYSGSQQLYAPERHTNQRDYVFSAGERNLDIKIYRFSDSRSSTLANSSVDDRLGTMSPNGKHIAYVSHASGSEEVWIMDSDGKNQRQLTRYNDQRHFTDLVWSPDGQNIAASTLNQLYLIDTANGISTLLEIPQKELRAVSFKNGQSIYFSLQEDGQWQLHQLNLASKELRREDNWQFVRFETNEEDTIWVDNANHIYTGNEKLRFSLLPSGDFDPVIGSSLNIRKQGDNWFWQTWDDNQYQMYQHNAKTKETKQLMRSDSNHYNLTEAGLLFSTLIAQNTDIFQTTKE